MFDWQLCFSHYEILEKAVMYPKKINTQVERTDIAEEKPVNVAQEAMSKVAQNCGLNVKKCLR